MGGGKKLNRIRGEGLDKVFRFRSLIAVWVLMCAFGASADGRPDTHADEFSQVQCGADISKALVGQKVTSGSAVDIENRHKELGLKDLGGTEISDTLFASSWKICGQEYMLLQDASVQDVLLFPTHSFDAPAFIGTCKINGKSDRTGIVAVLIRKKDMNEFPASIAWKIDEKLKRFVKISTEGVMCPAEYVFTEDGGL